VVEATFSLVSHCLIKLEGENNSLRGASSINVKKWVHIHTAFLIYNIYVWICTQKLTSASNHPLDRFISDSDKHT